MLDLHRYQVWCSTDSKWEYWWLTDDDAVPTTCPTDTGHTVDTSKTAIAKTVDVKVQDSSGRQNVHQSSKPIGSITYFSGEGDSDADVDTRGGGQEMVLEHKSADSTPETMDVWFNCINNRTWLHEGYVQWRNAEFDRISLSVVPKVIAHTTGGSGTNYKEGSTVGAPYLIIPATADGGIDITGGSTTLESHNGGLVYMPDTEEGTPPVAFWNADWNQSTEKFENITGAPAGNGRYNLFNTQITLQRFVNRFPLLGNGFIKMQTSDISELGHGMLVRLTLETNGANHDWDVSILLTMARMKTS